MMKAILYTVLLSNEIFSTSSYILYFDFICEIHSAYLFQVKDIYLHPDPFSVQNGLLTPTLKSKRPQLKAYFKPQIEDMYSKLT
jgi:long-subunit acyl-CoA synthetase (AMP-forming)